jgi:hypothetical protein
MEMQGVPFTLLSSYEVFLTAVNNTGLHVVRSSCKVPVTVFRFKKKIGVPRQIFAEVPNIRFTKIRPALTHADGQNRRKDRHDEANTHFSLFMRKRLKWIEVQGGNCRMQTVPLPKQHYFFTCNWCVNKAASILTHGTWNWIFSLTLCVLNRMQNGPEFCGKLCASADNRTCVVQGVVSPFCDSGHTAPEHFPGVVGLKMFCGRTISPMGSRIQYLNQSDVWCAS